MAASDRPGGLTALAAVNFLWAVVGMFGMLLVLITVGGVFYAARNPGAHADQILHGHEPAYLVTLWLVLGAWNMVEIGLLTASGIGYLRQRRVLGRWVGNVYGVLGIICNILVVQYLPVEMGGGGQYGIGNVTSLFYPAFTLVLLNLVFRRDFRR